MVDHQQDLLPVQVSDQESEVLQKRVQPDGSLQQVLKKDLLSTQIQPKCELQVGVSPSKLAVCHGEGGGGGLLPLHENCGESSISIKTVGEGCFSSYVPTKLKPLGSAGEVVEEL